MPATGLAYSESCILTRSNRQGVLHPVWPSEHHAISDHDDRGLLGHGRCRSRGLVPLSRAISLKRRWRKRVLESAAIPTRALAGGTRSGSGLCPPSLHVVRGLSFRNAVYTVNSKERGKCQRTQKLPERAPLRWLACSILGIQFGCKRTFWNSLAGSRSLQRSCRRR